MVSLKSSRVPIPKTLAYNNADFDLCSTERMLAEALKRLVENVKCSATQLKASNIQYFTVHLNSGYLQKHTYGNPLAYSQRVALLSKYSIHPCKNRTQDWHTPTTHSTSLTTHFVAEQHNLSALQVTGRGSDRRRGLLMI